MAAGGGIFVKNGSEATHPTVINVHCPVCRRAGAFHGLQNCADMSWNVKIKKRAEGGGQYQDRSRVGMRQCPNPKCGALVFFSYDVDSEEQTVYPPEVIDFDASNLPADILSTLEEAVKCHAAGCHRAAALMVRRTLEELCDDKAATGRDLKARIAALGAVAVVPNDLLTAADELRILGNDAAHIEAKAYDNIGKLESELAIELAKELLKAVYQYTSLVTRLMALKTPNTP